MPRAETALPCLSKHLPLPTSEHLAWGPAAQGLAYISAGPQKWTTSTLTKSAASPR